MTPCGYCLTLIIHDVVRVVIESRYKKKPRPDYLNHLTEKSIAMAMEAKEMAYDLECTIRCNQHVKRTYKTTNFLPPATRVRVCVSFFFLVFLLLCNCIINLMSSMLKMSDLKILWNFAM